MRISHKAIANRLAVTEISSLRSADALGDSRAANIIFEGYQPVIEFFGAQESIHIQNCIQSDTIIAIRK